MQLKQTYTYNMQRENAFKWEITKSAKTTTHIGT